ncbi:hypothetical protein [Brevibacillus choshinensis]|uniref:hypothetical protein n=1 Tax=Brevibacillus choshinensis TaxID=54911 RepID=UPI002E1C71A2|nr:hypothetical protein [Brevibacillus choshinensis]
MRDIQSRHNGLPPRTPDMLYNIVRKFYRGAVSHYDLIQEKKAVVRATWEHQKATGEDAELRQALHTLFLEFHFYVTCWLQIEMALFRLARQDEEQSRVLERFRPDLEKHLGVREQLDQTEACVEAQLRHDGPNGASVERDMYWFEGITFTVDEQSLQTLHALYEAIQQARTK